MTDSPPLQDNRLRGHLEGGKFRLNRRKSAQEPSKLLICTDLLATSKLRRQPFPHGICVRFMRCAGTEEFIHTMKFFDVLNPRSRGRGSTSTAACIFH